MRAVRSTATPTKLTTIGWPDAARRPSGAAFGIVAPAFVVGLAVFGLLAAFVGVDPAPGVTWSNSPYTDEGLYLLNARNFAVLGQWSVDDWNRQLLTIPYTAVHAAVFLLFGTGIVQARLVEISATAATAGLIAFGLGRCVGRWPAILGAVAFGTSTLVLYHGRLALLEPSVGLALTAGCIAMATPGSRRPALIGGLGGLAFALAIGTKALALSPVAGMIVGTAIAARWDRAVRRSLLAGMTVLAALAVGWFGLVFLPNASVVNRVAASLPPEPLPSGLRQAAASIRRFLTDDGVRLALPVLVGGMLGGAVGVMSWRRLSPGGRALLIAAIGWLVAGIGTLAIVPYSPNRYLEPMLPAFALLIGLGADTLAKRWHGARGALTRRVGFVAILATLAIPGLLAYAGWMSSSPTTLANVQAEYALVIPGGATVEGDYAPILGMRTTGPTIQTGWGMNPGDLYASRRVRWLVLADDEAPAWAALHPAAWSDRRLVSTTAWGPHLVSLYALP